MACFLAFKQETKCPKCELVSVARCNYDVSLCTAIEGHDWCLIIISRQTKIIQSSSLVFMHGCKSLRYLQSEVKTTTVSQAM
jgi:hypothetical protein